MIIPDRRFCRLGQERGGWANGLIADPRKSPRSAGALAVRLDDEELRALDGAFPLPRGNASSR
jgi:hypothetical protein